MKRKIIFFPLIIIILILIIEGIYYFFFINKKTSVSLDKEDISTVFNQCFLGKNIEAPGGLLELKYVSFNVDKNIIISKCPGSEKELLVLKLLPETRYFVNKEKERLSYYNYPSEFFTKNLYKGEPESFFKLINSGNTVQINIFENNKEYFVNSISI
jgi:hypothetical protein